MDNYENRIFISDRDCFFKFLHVGIQLSAGFGTNIYETHKVKGELLFRHYRKCMSPSEIYKWIDKNSAVESQIFSYDIIKMKEEENGIVFSKYENTFPEPTEINREELEIDSIS